MEVAAVAVALAAERELGAFVAADLRRSAAPSSCARRDHRAHLASGSNAAADAQPARALDDALEQLVVDALCTSTRVLHVQTWPEAPQTPIIAPAAAASRSASGKMIEGLLPPSSRHTRFTRRAAAAWIAPAGVAPSR